METKEERLRDLEALVYVCLHEWLNGVASGGEVCQELYRFLTPKGVDKEAAKSFRKRLNEKYPTIDREIVEADFALGVGSTLASQQ